jgi:periplasmic protein CpxP/Spy
MKGLTMTTELPTTAPTASLRRRLFNRQTLAAFVAGAALVGGIGVFAGAESISDWHHGMMMGGTPGAAEISNHVEHVLKHFYVEIDATDAQKAQIEPLVKQAVADLLPLHSQLRTAHTQALQALMQPTVDRGTLETARAQHLQLADQASKRITQLMADVGDVLTPAQRTALGERLQHMRGMPTS